MTIKISTGLANTLLESSGFKTTMNLGLIKVYSGVVPATADDSLGAAVLLLTISESGTATGLTMGGAAGGIIPKAPAETWSGLPVATGAASFYRHVAPGDTGAASTTERRVQGRVATVGADMNLANTTIVSGVSRTLDYYQINLPLTA